MTETALNVVPRWIASDVEAATRGTWIINPSVSWSATGVCIHPPTLRPGNLVVVKGVDGSGRGVSLRALGELRFPPAGIITSSAEIPRLSNTPVLSVPDTSEAILAMGRYARRQMRGKILAVTGSAGKTTTAAMLAHALLPWGHVGRTVHNANLPHGVAWNMASIAWEAPHIVLELAVGRMGISAHLARPHVAIFTNILPAHLGERSTTRDIAITKSAIFQGMSVGDVAVLNRDMLEWKAVYEAARMRNLNILHYGMTQDADFQLLKYDSIEQLMTARVYTRTVECRIGAAGIHMALNALSVIAAVSACGYPLEPALAQLETFQALPGRGEELELEINGKRLRIIDDAYNANPGSMAAALENLARREKTGRRIAVLGEMAELGPQAKDYHTELADLIERLELDCVHVAGALYADFWKRLSPGRRGIHANAFDELKHVLLEETTNGDIVLFKGSHSTRIHQLVSWIKTYHAASRSAASTEQEISRQIQRQIA